jgi:hypothetical protein
MTKSMKRIHKVVIKHMADTDGDTSWLGEYANSPTSEFSIDRAHDLGCIQQPYNKPTGEGLRVLESAQQYLCDRLNELQEVASDDEVPVDMVGWYDDGDSFIHDFLGNDDEEFCLGSCVSHWSNREYRYFNPSSNYVDKYGKALPENTPEEVRKYTLQDYERMESLNRGHWGFIGIRAEAEYYVSTKADDKTGKHGHFLMQTVTSGGIWGIESDSGKAAFEEVEAEELHDLRKQLAAIGFSSRAISAAFKDVQREEE